MIYATVKSVKEYNVIDPELGAFGIYDSYKDDPELLALILLTTMLGFDYEGHKPEGKRQCTVNEIEPFRQSLEYEIAGMPLKAYIQALTPLEFYIFIEKEDLLTLPLVTVTYSGRQDMLKMIVGVRAAAWALNYRGKVSTTGNVVKVAFGRESSNLDIPSDLITNYNAVKEKLSNGNR